MSTNLAEHIATLELVDNHVHGYWTGEVDRPRFENGLNEANTAPLAEFDSAFDTQIGIAVRAHCAPLLGLPAHADPDAYWQRRAQLSAQQLARTFLPAAGVSDWLVDTGLAGTGLAGTGLARVAGVDEVSVASGGAAREIVRLEQVAEEVLAAGGDYAETFRGMLESRVAKAAATKTVLAYRGGFDGDLSEPDHAEVVEAAARWRGAGGRLMDRVLLRFGIHQALRLDKPLQFHVGLGDRDADLHRTNPLLLLDFLRAHDDVPIVMLHCYPFEREAGYLASAFNHVHVDVGLSINHLGARSVAFIARTLELAPFRKVLYSSDGYGPPELHYLGARLWRDGMCSVLGEFVDRGQWSRADATRVATLVGRDNARRLYRL